MLKQFAVIFAAVVGLQAAAGAQVLDPKGGYRGSTMEALDAARLSPGPVAQPPHMGASIYNGQYNPNGFNPYLNGQYNPYANPGFPNGQVVAPYTQLPYPNNGYVPGAGYYQNGYPYANGNVPYNWNGNVPYNWNNIIDPLFRR